MIPEVKQAELDYRKARNLSRRKLNRLKKIKARFYFLDRIVERRKDTDSKENDIELERAILDLFKSIGFKSIKPKGEGDVDVKVKFKEKYLGIEVKNGNLVGENDIFQALKYKMFHNEEYHPLVVYNNTKHNDNWDSIRKTSANKGKFGLLLTTELKKGYLKLKTEKITFEQFLNQIMQTGEIKFSNKAIQKAYKSEID